MTLSGDFFVPVLLLLPALATNACRITTQGHTLNRYKEGAFREVTGWLLAWLIVTRLIVACRILVVSINMEARDRPVPRDGP